MRPPGLAMVLVLLVAATSVAAEPDDLGELVDLALTRDPSAVAAWLERDAARERAAGARQLPSPRFVLEMENVASSEPGMHVVGLEQMLPGWGERRALSRRFQVDAERWAAERERLRADLRLRLWQLAASLEADAAEIALFDEQVRQALALYGVSLARYRAGAGVDDPGSAMGGSAMSPTGATAAGTAPGMGGMQAPSGTATSAGPGMSGMGGMPGVGGPGNSPPSSVTVPTGAMPPSASDGMGDSGAMGGGGASLAQILRLDATTERLRAQLAGARAARDGRRAVLAILVGEDVAGVVAEQPGSFTGTPSAGVPESELARLAVAAAMADLDMARAARRPEVMVMAGSMHDDEMSWQGFEVELGVEIPVGGGLRRAVRAAALGVEAEQARSDAVTRGLALAVAEARAAHEAAHARSLALHSVAVPRANAAFEAGRRLLATGGASFEDVLLAWGEVVSVRREAIAARLETEMTAAQLARVEGR